MGKSMVSCRFSLKPIHWHRFEVPKRSQKGPKKVLLQRSELVRFPPVHPRPSTRHNVPALRRRVGMEFMHGMDMVSVSHHFWPFLNFKREQGVDDDLNQWVFRFPTFLRQPSGQQLDYDLLELRNSSTGWPSIPGIVARIKMIKIN